MNKFDETYEIRFGRESDIPAIMEFLELYWKSGHIMAKNRSFFEYEFLEPDGTVNMVLAIDRKTGSIEGLKGFLYASSNKEMRDLWGSIWKVKPGNAALLGVEIFLRVEQLTNCRYNIGIGANPETTIPIVKKLLHRNIGKMKHYYRLADKKAEEFKIAKVAYFPQNTSKTLNKKVAGIVLNSAEEFKRYFDIDNLISAVPYKDYNYVEKRYYRHPIYQYTVYGLKTENKVKAVLIYREQRLEDRKAIRVVDYLGDRSLMAGTDSFWKRKLSESGCEYIDFYCYGFEDEFLKDAGFSVLLENDKNIIPNYFYPFVQKNIDIWVHSQIENVLICKADGDQDRPNG